MRFIAVFVALGAVAGANHAVIAARVSASPQAYYCEYPKSVTVAGHTVTTPQICVPAP